MEIEELIDSLLAGKITKQEVLSQLKTIEDLGFAKLDFNRESRTGFAEAIFGEGKSLSQLRQITKAFLDAKKPLLITRLSNEVLKELCEEFKELSISEDAGILHWKPEKSILLPEGYISVVSAGTSDIAVAEEAALTAEHMGCRVERIYDVGIAGVHRLISNLDKIKESRAIVVVAGMDGVLPSLVGGLVKKPVIAIPTSIGYGANFNGLAPLLTMLNSCAAGVTVVNIDNGFGGGYAAALIHLNSASSQDKK
ncbi:MAG: nickel pincer cofactor biosynthesis protein LarB [Deltaproteobacteria bacterium]|nr:nickel pincer cofactor biosynthesis protein LarB [Deltaproteobacteria bacterium]